MLELSCNSKDTLYSPCKFAQKHTHAHVHTLIHTQAHTVIHERACYLGFLPPV